MLQTFKCRALTPEHLPLGGGCFLVSPDLEETAKALMFTPFSDRGSSVTWTVLVRYTGDSLVYAESALSFCCCRLENRLMS